MTSRRRVLQALVSVVVVAAIFLFALPGVTDYSEVLRAITVMTWLEITTLAALAAWNIVTYWFVMTAALPGLNLWQAMKVNLASTAVANTLPGGGAIGIGVTGAMFRSYGFSGTEIGLSLVITGIWNNFAKLGMPVIALALLALRGDASPSLVTASLAGVGVLVGVVTVFALIFRSESVARSIGERAGNIAARLRGLVGRKEPTDWGPAAVRFRGDTVGLLRERWVRLTLATLLSHTSLYVVLLVALRHVGVSSDQVSWEQVLAAFSFIRLISALPITPGGLGVVELGLIAALAAAAGPRAEVAAAVLVYRALTFLPPIPLGAISYLFWKKGAARRRERLEEQCTHVGEAAGP